MRMSETQRFGLYWEEWTLDQLHTLGYTDARLVSDYFADVDILLSSLPIEVKAAHPKKHWAGSCYRWRWQFDVSRLPKWSDSVVVMIALDHDTPYPYICPSWLLFGRYNVHITSHPTFFKGRLASCLHNWANVALVREMHKTFTGQMALFNMGTGVTPLKSQNGDAQHCSVAIQMGLSPVPMGGLV